MKKKLEELEWKVHTPNLFKEILSNNDNAILVRPLQILGSILYEVGERASELNDPELNALMCRLTLYEIADPEMKSYDPLVVKQVMDLAAGAKAKRLEKKK